MDVSHFLNWFDDEKIVKFEESLTEKEAKRFLPYITMFHALKNQIKIEGEQPLSTVSQKKSPKIQMPSDSNKEANELLQKLNTIKQRFNSSKGQADGMINDAISVTIQECANLMAKIMQDKQGLQMRITQLEAELQKIHKETKIPQNMKNMPDAEKPDPEPEK